MWAPPNRTISGHATAFLMILILASFLPLMQSEGSPEVTGSVPARDEGGPMVNRSVVDIVLFEGFVQREKQYFNATGFGGEDIFYDPNNEWKEGEDIPYPLKAFEVQYPSGYNRDTTPIVVEIVTYYLDTSFGMVTITENIQDWNNLIYGKEWFVINLIARNGTGESEAQIRFKVVNVNDRPTETEKDYFSIKMGEDSSYEGVNRYHDPINEIFVDEKDPFDTLIYGYDILNDLAENIAVDMPDNGSYVKFTPDENWSCPYLPESQRLRGKNVGDHEKYFAIFRFNCSDQDGLYIRKELYVYVSPENDVPIAQQPGTVEFFEDQLVSIQLEAEDVDIDQELVFGTNLTTSIYEKTLEQIEFQDEYVWDRDTGLMEFMTDNDFVGSYEVMAYVQDKSTESGRPDYPPTPFRVYQNFTLNVINVNDAPRARLDQPLSTFVYNTSSVIEFNASRTGDDDLIHGDELNYTWLKDGEVLGYGKLMFKTIDEVGTYNITLNVTDLAGIHSVDHVDIEVEKARVPGEIFDGKDLERTYSDNSTPVVISKTTKLVQLFEGGRYGLDVDTVTGTRNGAIFKVRIMFTEKLEFLYTEEVIQEPQVELYFLTDEFTEAPVEIDPQSALDYVFPVPFSNVRYTRLEYDLRGPSATYPPAIVPLDTIRMLDDGMGVEVTLTVVEMDDLGIKPEFELYAVAQMKTTIKDSNGQTLEVLSSWDSSGVNTNKPIISDAQEQDSGNESDSEFPIALVIIIIVIILVFVIVIVLLVVMMKGKKKEEPEPVATAQPQMSVEEEIMGGGIGEYPSYPSAQQMYGQQPEGQQQGLPQGASQQPGLPPDASQAQQPGLPPAEAAQGQPAQQVQTPPPATHPVPQTPPQGEQPQQPGQYIPPQ